MKLRNTLMIATISLLVIPGLLSATNTGVDGSFSAGNGYFSFNRDSTNESVQDAAIDSQGRILLAFYIEDDSGTDLVYWPAVIRLDADGSTDTSFGFLGVWMENTNDMTPECPINITVDSQDRPIIGWTFEFTQGVPPNTVLNRDGWIRRLTSAGISDIGKVWAFDIGIPGSGDRLDEMTDIMVLSDGRVVAVGRGQYDDTDWDYIIGVYENDGSGGLILDTDFGTGGRLSVGFDLSGSSLYDGAEAVTVDSTGNLVIAGSSHSSSGSLVSVCRISPSDGSLDSTFGAGGKATFAYSPTFDSALISWGVDVSSTSGGVVIAAKLYDSATTNWKFGALKVATNGGIDTTFGDGLLGAEGWIYRNPTYPSTPFSDASTGISGVTIDYDRLVFSATIGDPLDSNQSMGLVFVTNLSGQAMTSFSSGGYDFYSFEPTGEQVSTGFSTVLIPGSGLSLFAIEKAVLVGNMRGITGGGSRTDVDVLATQIHTGAEIFSDGFESGGTTAWSSVSN